MLSSYILVTGGSGFIGQELLKYLKDDKVLYPNSNELNLLNEDSILNYFDSLKLNKIEISCVYHLGVMYNSNKWSQDNSYSSGLQNSRIIVLFFDILDRYFPGVMVITTLTYGLYGVNSDDNKEGDLHGNLNFTNGYVLSKVLMLNLINFRNKNYRRICSLGIIVPTVYRGYVDNKIGSFFSDIAHKIKDALQGNSNIILFDGNKDSIIELLHVNDLVRELVRVKSLTFNTDSIFNLGSNEKCTLESIVLEFCRYYGYQGSIKFSNQINKIKCGMDSSLYYSFSGCSDFLRFTYVE